MGDPKDLWSVGLVGGSMVAWVSGEGLRAGRVALSPPLLWAGGSWRVVVVSI